MKVSYILIKYVLKNTLKFITPTAILFSFILLSFLLPNNGFSQSLKVELEKELKEYQEKKENYLRNSSPNPNKELDVVQHFKGTEGIALTSVAKAEKPVESALSKYLRENNNIKINYKVIPSNIKPKPQTAKVLPDCKKPSTRKIIIKNNNDKESTFADFIFLKNKDIPKDPDLKFGLNTVVIQYKGGEPDPMSFYLYSENLNCLPTRKIITNKTIYYYEGDVALKNYDNKRKDKK